MDVKLKNVIFFYYCIYNIYVVSIYVLMWNMFEDDVIWIFDLMLYWKDK